MSWPWRAPVALLLALIAARRSPVPAKPAAGADDPGEALRPCKRARSDRNLGDDPAGNGGSAAVDPADPLLSPYQRFAFRSDAGLRRLSASAAVGPEEQRAILTAPATTTWSVDRSGRLLIRKGAAAPEVDACQVLLTKISDPRSRIPGLPGDMLLTHYGRDGQPVASQLLRKISGRGEFGDGPRAPPMLLAPLRGPEELEDAEDQERAGAERAEQDHDLVSHPRLHVPDLIRPALESPRKLARSGSAPDS
jgi:hypothetical protein